MKKIVKIKKKYPRRGFASMDKAKQQAIAGKGGRKAHAIGHAHKWDSKEAAVAGKIGGKKTQQNRLAKEQGERLS